MKKAIIALLIVAVLLSLCSCSNKSVVSTPSDVSTADESTLNTVPETETVDQAVQSESPDESENAESTELAEPEPEPEQKLPETSGVTITDNRVNNSSTASNNNDTSSDSPEKDESTQPAQISEDDFEYTSYAYENNFGDTYWFLEITNNSTAAVGISANGLAKDANGNSIGAADLNIPVLGPGETTMEYFYFDDVVGVDSVEYQFAYDATPHYYPVLSNLAFSQTLNSKNVVVTVTNNGNTCAEFVEAYVLFMDEADHVISFAYTYIIDNNSEIKPGDTLSGQLNCRESYDHVVTHLTSRSNGKEYSKSSQIDQSQFEISELLYASPFGDTLYYLVIKNNSDLTVDIDGNATAKDASGCTIGASGFEDIAVLAPGETSIGYFIFDSVSIVADVDYQLFIAEETYFKPVLSGISADVVINSNNVLVSATNNGSIPAKFLEAFVLFVDANGNIVDRNYSYLTDNDSEIKVGATQTKQFKTSQSYDHVLVFFTGRG